MGRHDRVAALALQYADGTVATDAEVADVGCGTGRTVRALLALGARRVHALDHTSDLDDDLIVHAGVRSHIADLTAPVLPVRPETLAAAVSLNVVEHLIDPVNHVVACHRALSPGGVLVLAHSDWDTMLFTSNDDKLTRRLVDHFVDSLPYDSALSDGFMGRKLLSLASLAHDRDAAFALETVESWADPHRRFDNGSLAWKVATAMLAAANDDPLLAASASGWMEDMRSISEAGQFLFTVTDVALKLRKAI